MPGLLVKPGRPWALRLLPPFPHIANRVLTLVNQEDCSVKPISDVIRTDPSFTAEILRLANSALFGASRQVTTVAMAVTRMGMESVKSCAILIAINSMVKSSLRIGALKKCWVHSLVSAIVTEELARAAGMPAGPAYTIGLLHDLGTLGLMAAYPEEYARMLDVSKEYGYDLILTERDLFEIDHCAAGAFLAEEWNFPDEIGVAIATHHFEPSARDLSLNNVVRVGWRLADVLGYSGFPPEKPWTYEELIAATPNGRRSWLGAGIEEATREIATRLASAKV